MASVILTHISHIPTYSCTDACTHVMYICTHAHTEKNEDLKREPFVKKCVFCKQVGRGRLQCTVEESGMEGDSEKGVVPFFSLEGFIGSMSCELGTEMGRKDSKVEVLYDFK